MRQRLRRQADWFLLTPVYRNCEIGTWTQSLEPDYLVVVVVKDTEVN